MRALSGTIPAHERNFWWRHAVAPLAAFAMFVTVLAATPLDMDLARSWAWDAHAGRWLGTGTWWAGPLLHESGRDVILGVIAVSLVLAFAAWRNGGYLDMRSRASYVVLSMVLTCAIVGAMKRLSGIDCPWDLKAFGGAHSYTGLFAVRSGSGSGACFPGAHSASGFSLFAFYFALLRDRPRQARLALWVAILVGSLFAFGQEARGAHFLSHDVTSAVVAWFICLGIWLLWQLPRARAAETRVTLPASPPRSSARHARSRAPAGIRSSS